MNTRLALLLAGTAVGAGCATHSLDGARHQFYQGRLDQAAQSLESFQPTQKEQILYLMERGMIRQEAGRYAESSRDFIAAAAKIEEFEAYSVSEGAGSWVINDTVYTFRGKPYERTLLHAFTALNFFALGAWDSAAVEARRILEALDPAARGDYPDDPYSRYMAGFCFEMIDDPSNASIQYKTAADMAEWAAIDPETGRIHDPNEPGQMPPAPADWGELVCFVHMGRSFGTYQGSTEYASPGPYYAEIYAGTQYLGRSYTIVDTAHLAALTAKEEALRKTAKTAARIALKEGLAHAAAESTNSGEVGDLARLILFGLLEQPDMRHWDTLPRWLQIARVPCPPNTDAVEVVIRYRGGREAARYTITSPPLAYNRQTQTSVAFCRHLAEQ
jgi:uncharacterized protein